MDSYGKKIFNRVVDQKPVLWENKNKAKFYEVVDSLDIKYEDIVDAKDRLKRFAPLVKRLFPETNDGIIESPLVKGNNLRKKLEKQYNANVSDIYLKCDSHLKVAGSIKARGGIYEVLKYAERIGFESKLLDINDDYSKLGKETFRKLFSKYKIVVGSTGNLGMSVGIMSSALGFNVTVHMSRDAKEWKKSLLRKRGVNVVEHEEDYTKAVAEGRKQCENDKFAYFIDDENSKDLFLGYSVAAFRLHGQLKENGIAVDKNNPLYVYLPCGVGGAPGGITFGLKHIYGDNVKCYFIEPTHSPCMLLGLLTKKYSEVNVKDYGIDNITEADGLAVGSPSGLVSKMAEKLINGIYTVDDNELFKLLRLLKDTEDLKIEPSAAASLLGPIATEGKKGVHICWLTGGLFLPKDIYLQMYTKGSNI